MSRQFVRILSNIDCSWAEIPPVYRLYVNDELFAERTWRWRDSYLQEAIQLEGEPGEYTLRYELVTQEGKLSVGDLSVDTGPVEVIDSTHFRILR